MNRSFFPVEDGDYNSADDTHDESEDFEAYVAQTRNFRPRPFVNMAHTTDADVETDDGDDEYIINLKGWNTRMGRRPVTRSMTRSSASALQTRVMSLRSSRR